MRAPKRLRELLKRRSGQVQKRIAWPRDRWSRVFPGRLVFRVLPPTLDRDRIRRTCATAGASVHAATNAFLATMDWGYGNVGYGAWRVAQAFKDRDAGRKLLKVVRVLNDSGPHAAYRLMAGPSRLNRIGPAFGTKFHFADSGRHKRHALILDRLVAEWLSRNACFRVNPVAWAPPVYDAYLVQIHEWADDLEVEPDAVELAVFQEMSESGGGQWASGR